MWRLYNEREDDYQSSEKVMDYSVWTSMGMVLLPSTALIKLANNTDF